MADIADSAFSHASAVLGSGDAAVDAAVAGVRRGGRSRTAVLGHTRAAALGHAGSAEPPDLDAPAPTDLGELAVALAATRPPLERAIVDLDLRHGLDSSRFGRALGLPPAAAAERSAAVTAAWQRDLDPALLASLGPGECSDLAAVLREEGVGDGGGATVAALLAVAPAVAEHVDGCHPCRDRLRAMVSVRTLLGRAPLAIAPETVRAAARASRFRRPTSAPPPLFGARRPRRWLPAAAAAVVAVAAAGATVVAIRRTDSGNERVALLTRIPDGTGSLRVAPAVVYAPKPATVNVTNAAGRTLAWSAGTDVPWLHVDPASARAEPGARRTVRLTISRAAPEGEARATVTFTADDGSSTVVRIEGVIERPPDVSAAASGCQVDATVEDESEIEAVLLHWREPTGADASTVEKSLLMVPSATGYREALPATATTWWVRAVDARGNTGRTPETRAACAPPA